MDGALSRQRRLNDGDYNGNRRSNDRGIRDCEDGVQCDDRLCVVQCCIVKIRRSEPVRSGMAVRDPMMSAMVLAFMNMFGGQHGQEPDGTSEPNDRSAPERSHRPDYICPRTWRRSDRLVVRRCRIIEFPT
jgi:hypothetical protein